MCYIMLTDKIMPSLNQIKIGISISSTEERFDSLLCLVKSSVEALNEADQVIIIIQNHSSLLEDNIMNEWKRSSIVTPVSIIVDKEKGLSRSRNIAIDQCTTDYLWILDDDVTICHDSINNIKKAIQSDFSDIYCGRVKYTDKNGLFKSYTDKSILKKLDCLKVMSIEIILSTKFLKKTKIKFFNNIGLGTKFPAGGETLFLLEAYDAGAIIRHIPKVIVMHPFESDNFYRKWRNPNVMLMKGVVARKTGIFLGSILTVRWCIRALMRGLSLKDIQPVLKGFFQGFKLTEKHKHH